MFSLSSREGASWLPFPLQGRGQLADQLPPRLLPGFLHPSRRVRIAAGRDLGTALRARAARPGRRPTSSLGSSGDHVLILMRRNPTNRRSSGQWQDARHRGVCVDLSRPTGMPARDNARCGPCARPSWTLFDRRAGRGGENSPSARSARPRCRRPGAARALLHERQRPRCNTANRQCGQLKGRRCEEGVTQSGRVKPGLTTLRADVRPARSTMRISTNEWETLR